MSVCKSNNAPRRAASERACPANVTSQNGFKPLCDMLRRYSLPLDHSSCETDDDVINMLVEASGCPGSIIDYRTVIHHFVRYLRSNRLSLLSITHHDIEEFLAHRCTKACAPSRTPVSGTKGSIIARLCLFLQYQGVVDPHGWSKSDPDLCEQFLASLISEGVGTSRACVQAKAALHFIVWSRLRGIAPSSINDGVVDEFARHDCWCGLHLSSGHLDRQAETRRRVAVRRFLRFRAGESAVFHDGVFYQGRERVSLWPSALRYKVWLSEHRGLKPRTIYFYVLDVMSWLPSLGEDAALYSAASIRSLALSEFSKRSIAMQGRFVRSMRSYLQFRAYEGDCSISLVHAIISRPTYRLSSIPRRLDLASVRRVIDSCDVTSPRGVRDRAILILLSELGLRATEVWRLRTTDFNWREARLNILGKGGRGAVVPLTQGAGDAVLDYLERVRPATESDVLFLRLSRPHVPLANAAEISGIAKKALGRCGFQGGAHVFRHTLATELLRSGRALEDVATILRHRSTETTMIYAKVNETMLKRLADPWMGEAR